MYNKNRCIDILKKGLNGAAMIVVGIVFCLPFIWMVLTAFKSLGDTILIPPKWILDELHWENFTAAWNSGPFPQYICNSIITTGCILILQFLVGIPAAYAYAKCNFPGKNLCFGITMVTMMIPSQLVFLPIYLLMSRWGLLNTYAALVLPFVGSAFTIFLLRQSFMQIPQEVIDAARIDGAGEFQIIFKIVIPLAKPAMVTAGLFSFITHWNDYFWPLIMTTNDTVRTLPIGIAKLREVEGGVAWNILMAGNVIMVIPILILFFVAQRQIIKAFVYSSK